MSNLLTWIGPWSATVKPALEHLLRASPNQALSGGWGLSGFSNGRAVYFGRSTEPVAKNPAAFEKAFDKADHTRPSLMVAQEQVGTTPTLEIRNVGPFHHRDWVFSQHGRIPFATMLPLHDAQSQGPSPEERFFLWLSEFMLPALKPTDELVHMIQTKCRKMTYKNLTFIISDGKTVWVYHEINDRGLQKGETLEERQRTSALYSSSFDGGMALCTQPLPNWSSDWLPFPNKTLAVITVEPFSSGLLPV